MSKTLLKQIIPTVSWHFALFFGERAKLLSEIVACSRYVMNEDGLCDPAPDRLVVGKQAHPLSISNELRDFFGVSAEHDSTVLCNSYFGLVELYSEDGVTLGDLLLTKWESR